MDTTKTTPVTASFTPALEPPAIHDREFGEATLRIPVVDKEFIALVRARVESATDSLPQQNRIERAVTAIDKAVSRWCHPTYPLRTLAEQTLPKTSGYTEEMIDYGLPRVLKAFRRPGLEALLVRELGLAWAETTLRGPRLITQFLAGNIPAVAAESIVRALLLGSGSILKSSSRDPLFPALFAQSIAEADPGLASTISVLWWKGGSGALDKAAVSSADAVVAYGRNDTINSVGTLVARETPFVGYGPRISFTAISREALKPGNIYSLTTRATEDVCLFDQQGCVSPHSIFVERGGDLTPRDFASSLAQAMATFEDRFPRGRLGASEAGLIASLRGDYEVLEAAARDVTLFTSPDSTAWTVIYDGENPRLLASCLNRVIHIKPVDNIMTIGELLSPFGPLLQTAGLECDLSRRTGIRDALEEAGVTRVCPIGQMQYPPASWNQDGATRLKRFLR